MRKRSLEISSKNVSTLKKGSYQDPGWQKKAIIESTNLRPVSDMPVKGRYDKVPNNQEEPSREKPGLMSLLSFHWITETFKTGNCRPLEKSDLLPNDEDNKTKALTEKLQILWHDEKEMRQKCGKKPRLWICVCKLLPFKEIFTIVILNMAQSICRVLRPLLLGIILSNLTPQNQDKTVMYACAALLCVTSMGGNLAKHLRRWVAEGHGAKICCALKGIIYAKVSLSYISLLIYMMRDVQHESSTIDWYVANPETPIVNGKFNDLVPR